MVISQEQFECLDIDYLLGRREMVLVCQICGHGLTDEMIDHYTSNKTPVYKCVFCYFNNTLEQQEAGNEYNSINGRKG